MDVAIKKISKKRKIKDMIKVSKSFQSWKSDSHTVSNLKKGKRKPKTTKVLGVK